MADISYSLTETVVKISAQSVRVTDPFQDEGNPRTTVEDLTIEVVNAADPNDRVVVELFKGDREVTATLAPDGRLQSLEYNSVGGGKRVVAGIGKLIAFVGTLVLGVARAGITASQAIENALPAADDAETAWAREHQAEHDLHKYYLRVHEEAAAKLAALRGEIVAASDLGELRAIQARANAVERVVSQAREEISRLVKFKAAWRESKRVTVRSDLRTVVRFTDIGRRAEADLAPPRPDELTGSAHELWRDFGIILEERSAARVVAEPKTGAASSNGSKSVDVTTNHRGTDVIWRVPRELELWTWKRGDSGVPMLLSREVMQVCDEESERREMRLTTSIFGEHGGRLEFGDDGSPGSLTHRQESTAGAFVDALSGATDAVAGAVVKAKETAESLSAVRDLGAERARAAAARDLEIAKNRLELAGVHATSDDYAELQRAKQTVELQKVNRELGPATPDPLAELKRELEQVSTENAIAAERRSAQLDLELAELRGEVARLQLEASRAEAVKQVGARRQQEIEE